MSRVAFSDLRNDLAHHLDVVERDRAELVVARPDHEDVVILPLAELERLRETLFLLGTPENARRILAAAAQLDAGGGTERVLIEP